MAVDLTRFDFHAKRFYFSESVRAMSAEEVGQYMLLLIEAWMGGKDTTLPNNGVYLAQLARAKEVSPLVMSQFHLVETQWGQRYQNETLFEEWLVCTQRQEAAIEAGRKGGASTSVYKTDAARENGRLGGRPKLNPSETEGEPKPKPIQTNPNQSKPSQYDSGTFKNLAVRYRRVFHVNLSHGNIQKEEYSKACREFSEDIVLSKFDDWSPDNLWIRERRHTNGLRQFYESLPAMIEADISIELGQRAEETAKMEQQNIIESSISAAQEAHRLEEEDLRRTREVNDELIARIAANPDVLFQS